MKVMLAVATRLSRDKTAIPHFIELANQDRFGVHELTDDPANADIILFVDPHQHPEDWTLKDIRFHPFVRNFPSKVMVYNERDRPWCALPGLYVGMPRRTFDYRRQRACAYHSMLNHEILSQTEVTPDLLFSFMGAMTHPIRRRILQLRHKRACVKDTSAVNFFDFSGNSVGAVTLTAAKKAFSEIVCRSKFVLCPRGAGTSSIRLFEVLAAGRVPVIVSDQWVAPEGPAWGQCAVRVRERDVHKIPEILEAKEGCYDSMAQAVRQAYIDWFAPDVLFHRFVESCREILESGVENRRQPIWLNLQYLHYMLSHSKAWFRDRNRKVKY